MSEMVLRNIRTEIWYMHHSNNTKTSYEFLLADLCDSAGDFVMTVSLGSAFKPGGMMSKAPTAPIGFTRDAVREHLDDLIRLWRDKRALAESTQDVDGHKMARCYIDAFQSVRHNLFGNTLT